MRTKKYDIDGVGQRLKQRRIERKMSVGTLAKRTGLGKATISRIEKGTTIPLLSVFAVICEELNVDMNKICLERKEPTTNDSEMS